MTTGNGGEDAAPSVHHEITTQDLEVFDILARNRSGELASLRAIAIKWITWATALPALVTAAALFGDLNIADAAKNTAAAAIFSLVLLLLGALLSAVGLYLTYRAAYGNPMSLDGIETIKIAGLAARYDAEVLRVVDAARADLARGVKATIIGVCVSFVACCVLVGSVILTPSDSQIVCRVDRFNVIVVSGDCPTGSIPEPKK